MDMKKSDVIIILGGGTDGTLKPAFYTKERLDAVISKYSKFIDIPIIASGGYTASSNKAPKYTEAEIIKTYLKKNGFSTKLIYLEKKSRDTIGNAYYSKQIVKRHPEWKNILLITTDKHVPRSRWLFNKVFGDKYVIHYHGVPSHHSSFTNPGRKKYEQFLIEWHKKISSHIKNGDDKSILKLLKTIHPAYAHTKKSEQVKMQIIAEKQKYLGYIKLPGVK